MKIFTSGIGGSRGRGIFLSKLFNELKISNVTVTDCPEERHDISLHIAKIRIKTHSKKILRIDGVPHGKDSCKKYNEKLISNFHEFDGVIYQSKFTKRLVDRYLGEFKKKSKIIYNGSPLNYYNVENAEKEYKYNFVCIARWRIVKRLEDIIESFLLADLEDSCLFVVGDLEKNSISDENMERYNEIENIKFLGKIDNKRLGYYFAICDACIHLCWTDCCPNTVIESLTSGCPVICNNIGGTPELVSLAGGIICDIDQEYDLEPVVMFNIPKIDRSKVAEAIIKSTEKKIIVDGRCFDIKNIAKQYLDFFHEILTENEIVIQGKSRII